MIDRIEELDVADGLDGVEGLDSGKALVHRNFLLKCFCSSPTNPSRLKRQEDKSVWSTSYDGEWTTCKNT